jgi:hypothetical protein
VILPIPASIVILIGAAAQKADDGWFSLTEAIVAALGVTITAIFGYLGVRYANRDRGAVGTNALKPSADPKQTPLVNAALARVDALKDTTSPDRRLKNEKSRAALAAAAAGLDRSKDSDLYELVMRLVDCTDVDTAVKLKEQITERITDHRRPRWHRLWPARGA